MVRPSGRSFSARLFRRRYSAATSLTLYGSPSGNSGNWGRRSYGVDNQTAFFIQDTHKELLTFAKEQNNSNEVACLLDLTTGEKLDFVKGD